MKKQPPQKSALEWARDVAADPLHQEAVEALMTEMNLAQDLAVRRDQRGLTQVELAQRAGVTQAMLSKLEAGKARNLELRTIVKIAAALGARVKITLEPMGRKTKRKTAAA
jgi:HTH-type transcriptional regulator/antitoxin HipB